MSERVITIEGFLESFLSQSEERQDHPFCFILGAGASVQSGIPTGSELARRWLEEMHVARDFDKLPLETWATADTLGIPGFSLSDVGSFYPEIYEQRFKGHTEQGYAFLEHQMDRKDPSFGYAALAYLMSKTQHRIAITTNFDNLIGDALSIHSERFPLIISDEQLAGFLSANPRRPLVSKIHGTVGFKLKNTRTETRDLCEIWRVQLEEVLSKYTPVVIGYAGNDGSLMGLLEGLPAGVPENVYWLVHSDEKEPHKIWNSVPGRIQDLIEKKCGQIVPIPGFDEIMLLLYSHLAKFSDRSEFPDLFDRLKQRDARREENFDKQVQEITKRLHPSMSPNVRPAAGSTAPTAAQTGDIVDLLKNAVVGLTARRAEKPWWKWVAEANSATGIDQKQAIYEKALKESPESAPLLSTYAIFLSDQRNNYDAAEAMFARAVKADRNDVDTLANYATFLTKERKNYDAAEAMFKQALDIDPDDPNILVKYAIFLTENRKNYDAAEAMFKRALDAGPIDARTLTDYATFLTKGHKDTGAAEAMYKLALRVDSNNADTLCNYAVFLTRERRNHDAAEAMYKQAVQADPNNANTLVNYATFLAKERRDNDAAERMYKRAVEADPGDATNLGNYAFFLNDRHKDYDAAETMFKRAVEADPTNATNLGNYAFFLSDRRKDYDAAETMFKRAVEADPANADNLSNYAVILSDRRKDYDAAETMFKRALQADPNNANILGNYADFLSNQRKDYDAAETMFKRALQADPNNANILGNYAFFLSDRRKDYDAAEAMFKRALKVDSNHPNNLGRYSLFLNDQRKNYDAAEAMFKRALKADPNNANTLGNYAVFLTRDRQDYDAAEAMFKRAVQADPNNANTLVNYATFLAKERSDNDAAGRMYKRAVEADPDNTNNLGRYALFLNNQRKDYVAAEAMYKRTVEADPDDANNLSNYAGFLFGLGRLPEGTTYLKRAELIEEKPRALEAELLFYRAAHDPGSWPKVLTRLRELIEAGARSPGWSFEANIARAKKNGHPNVALLRALAKVITEAADPAQLSEFAAWRKAGSSSPQSAGRPRP